MTEDEQVDYWELGFNLHRKEPDLILARVWWRAGELSKRREDQFDFVSGYGAARRQKDGYAQEKDHEPESCNGRD
jgi:hypothetical protein